MITSKFNTLLWVSEILVTFAIAVFCLFSLVPLTHAQDLGTCTYTSYDGGTNTFTGLSCSASGATLTRYEPRTSTGTFWNYAYQDNEGNYYLNLDFRKWQDWIFYAVLFVPIGVYFFIKIMRKLFDLFFPNW